MQENFVRLCIKLCNIKNQDFVIATGKQYTVRDFVKKCFKYFNVEIKFFGSGLNEKAK